MNGYAISWRNQRQAMAAEGRTDSAGTGRYRKSAAFQIIQLAELVKRFAHKEVNVGDIALCCTILGRNPRLCAVRRRSAGIITLS